MPFLKTFLSCPDEQILCAEFRIFRDIESDVFCDVYFSVYFYLCFFIMIVAILLVSGGGIIVMIICMNLDNSFTSINYSVLVDIIGRVLSLSLFVSCIIIRFVSFIIILVFK